MVPEINYWAVLLATASSMVVGTIWYTPKVFGTRWSKLAKVDMDRPGASATIAIIVTVLVSFVTAWVLAGSTAIAWHFYGGGYLWTAIVTAVTLWAGFTAAGTYTMSDVKFTCGRLDLYNQGEWRGPGRPSCAH